MSITTMEYKVVLNNADCGVIISEHVTSDVRGSFEIVSAGQKQNLSRLDHRLLA